MQIKIIIAVACLVLFTSTNVDKKDEYNNLITNAQILSDRKEYSKAFDVVLKIFKNEYTYKNEEKIKTALKALKLIAQVSKDEKLILKYSLFENLHLKYMYALKKQEKI